MAKDGERLRIAFALYGTRGDFQPFLSLAIGLKARGHTVRIYTASDHCKSSKDLGIDAEFFCRDVDAFFKEPKAKLAMEKGDFALMAKATGADTNDPNQSMFGPLDFVLEDGSTTMQAIDRCCESLRKFKPDMYCHNGMGNAPEFMRIINKDFPDAPIIEFALQAQAGPFSNTYKPIVWARPLPDPDTPYIMAHVWAFQLPLEATFRAFVESQAKHSMTVREVAEHLDTPELVFRKAIEPEKAYHHRFLCYSPSIFPPSDDWPKEVRDGTCNLKILGNLKISKEEQAMLVEKGVSFFTEGTEHSKCEEFLRGGRAPVYVGWGSMVVYSSEHMSCLAVEALKIANERGVVVGGWAGLCLESLNDHPELQAYAKENVIFLKKAPHEWLFPQCKCAVHHGGVGTLQASLSCGTPTIITPVFADQEENAAALETGGWGAGTTQLGKLKAAELGAAIKKVCSSQAMADKTAELVAACAKEDGVKRCCDEIEQIEKDYRSGKHVEKKKAQWEECVAEREKNEKKSWEAWQGIMMGRLARKFPGVAQFNKEQTVFFVQCQKLVAEKRLWYVTGSASLARQGESIKSEEVGRFKTFCLLEEVEKSKKNDRMRMKKLKGWGPEEGWVSAVVSDKAILKRAEDASEIMKVEMEKVAAVWSDMGSLGGNLIKKKT